MSGMEIVGGNQKRSTGDITINDWTKVSGKRREPLLGGVNGFPRPEGSCYTNQRTVTTVEAHRIGHEIELGPIFAGQGPVVRQIPVKNQHPVLALGDHIAVGGE